MQFEITKDYLEQFELAVKQKNNELIRSLTEGLHAADISSVLENSNKEDSKYVFELLELELQAEIISNLDEDIRKNFLKIFSSKEITDFILLMDSDDAADTLQEQSIQIREEVINTLNKIDPAIRPNSLKLTQVSIRASAGALRL